jgi:endonuclease/exonuclease/phosphatase family metal-dependent hydrolase
LTDILLAALREMEPPPRGPWIIGGDLNLPETFDSWQGGPRGNLEYLERMSAFGLTECLRYATGTLTPTFRNAADGRVVHQMDHLFVSQPLAARLASCRVGSPDRVFDERLSDHLPIIAEFTAP